MTVDLRSDTVTRPTTAMKEAMMNAPLGDDVFAEDPTVIELEQYAANLFGKEAALYCASGVMTNQIAIKVHTQPGDEIICDKTSHIYLYEGGGIMVNSNASVKLIDGDRGRISVAGIENNINPDDIHFPITKLVSVENTCNKGGGCFYKLSTLQELSDTCKKHGLKYHLDGARLFNALVENGDDPAEYGKIFDTISICLSKGLGAPIGSLLLGTAVDIKKARRIRKYMGGAMRQVGIIAAAGLYALKNNVNRMKKDHDRARALEEILQSCSYVNRVVPVETNIVVFELTNKFTNDTYLALRKENGIIAVPFGPQLIRFVSHMDFTDEMLEHCRQILPTL